MTETTKGSLRIALITAESYSSGGAVAELIDRLSDKLAVVITSHPEREKSLIREASKHWRRSGPQFLWYLLLNFSVYRLMTGFRERARIQGRFDISIRRRCQRAGVLHAVTRNINDNETLRRLAGARPDVIVIFYFDKILHEQAIATASRAVVNVHAAMLPGYRGLFPEFWALANGDPLGVTVHKVVDRGIDCGPILAQRGVSVRAEASVLLASRLVNAMGVELVMQVLEKLSTDDLPGIEPEGPSTYFSFPKPADVHLLETTGRKLARLGDVVQRSTRLDDWARSTDGCHCSEG